MGYIGMYKVAYDIKIECKSINDDNVDTNG